MPERFEQTLNMFGFLGGFVRGFLSGRGVRCQTRKLWLFRYRCLAHSWGKCWPMVKLHSCIALTSAPHFTGLHSCITS